MFASVPSYSNNKGNHILSPILNNNRDIVPITERATYTKKRKNNEKK